MSNYIRTGGVQGGRDLNYDDDFETQIAEIHGADIRSNEGFARLVWSALTNIEWRHESGVIAIFSFRAAGDVIAAIRGEGDYLDWYCCGEAGLISERVSVPLTALGWFPRSLKGGPP